MDQRRSEASRAWGSVRRKHNIVAATLWAPSASPCRNLQSRRHATAGRPPHGACHVGHGVVPLPIPRDVGTGMRQSPNTLAATARGYRAHHSPCTRSSTKKALWAGHRRRAPQSVHSASHRRYVWEGSGQKNTRQATRRDWSRAHLPQQAHRVRIAPQASKLERETPRLPSLPDFNAEQHKVVVVVVVDPVVDKA